MRFLGRIKPLSKISSSSGGFGNLANVTPYKTPSEDLHVYFLSSETLRTQHRPITLPCALWEMLQSRRV